jgi:hypothetical protein
MRAVFSCNDSSTRRGAFFIEFFIAGTANKRTCAANVDWLDKKDSGRKGQKAIFLFSPLTNAAERHIITIVEQLLNY